MKQSEMQIGHIYGDCTNKHRELNKIECHDDGKWYAHYTRVGYLIIRGKIHYMDKATCLLSTFARWAWYGVPAQTYLKKRLEQNSPGELVTHG